MRILSHVCDALDAIDSALTLIDSTDHRYSGAFIQLTVAQTLVQQAAARIEAVDARPK